MGFKLFPKNRSQGSKQNEQATNCMQPAFPV
jgi:hypothetical protein